MRVTKKSSSRVIFFCGKSCKPVTRITTKKITRLDGFFVHAFTAKKITRLDALYTHLQPKNYTACNFFCYTHLLPKNLHDLTGKKQIPILLKMHACRQCAHLWATSDFPPRLALGTPENARVT